MLNIKRIFNNEVITNEGITNEYNRIVFTNGCFDILHPGHIRLLKFCKSFNYPVIVGLNTDNSIKMIKPNRPINNFKFRYEMISAIKYVKYIIPFDQKSPIELIKILKPKILVKGMDWIDKENDECFDYILSYGGEVIFYDSNLDISTTKIINFIKNTENIS